MYNHCIDSIMTLLSIILYLTPVQQLLYTQPLIYTLKTSFFYLNLQLTEGLKVAIIAYNNYLFCEEHYLLIKSENRLLEREIIVTI